MDRRVIIILLLVAAIVAAFFPAGSAGFVSLDDDAYVEQAVFVNRGFTRSGVAWALSSIHTANWHPLTTLSHMLDCHSFGKHAGMMHWENIAWHAMNAVLVFLAWHTMTGALGRAAVVAALFALHPLHVESVAWISSRKDLLSTFFWLLGILAYVRWTRRRSLSGYVAVNACLVLALLAKPMAVTFPVTLLLLDLWPLRRWPANGIWPLFREKAALFLIVALHAVTTYFVQHLAGAAAYAARFDWETRIGNAFVAYARYLGKTVWPETLSPLYHLRGAWPLAAVAGALLLFAAVSFVAWWQRHRRPWVALGWLWFVGTLVPVIGLIQVGAQSMADRYTYVPLLGVFTVAAWFGAEFVGRTQAARRSLAAAVVGLLVALIILTSRQTRAWSDSITLYRSSIAAGEDSAPIRYLLATALHAAGRPEPEVVAEYQRALALQPDYVNALTQLAGIALRRSQFAEARRIANQAIAFEPKNPGLHLNLAMIAGMEGRSDEAVALLEHAIALKPDYGQAHLELARLLARLNRLPDALRSYARASELIRWDPQVLTEFGTLAANLGDPETGRRNFSRAVWIDPTHTAAQQNLSTIEQLLRSRRR